MPTRDLDDHRRSQERFADLVALDGIDEAPNFVPAHDVCWSALADAGWNYRGSEGVHGWESSEASDLQPWSVSTPF